MSCLFKDRCVFWVISDEKSPKIKPYAIISNQRGRIDWVPSRRIVCIESKADEAKEYGPIMCCGCDMDGCTSIAAQLFIAAQLTSSLRIPHGVNEGMVFKILIRNTFRAKSESGTHYNIPDDARPVRVTQLIKSMFYPFNPEDTARRAIGMTKKAIKKAPSEYYMDWAIKRMIGTVTHAVIEQMLNLFTLTELAGNPSIDEHTMQHTIYAVDNNKCDHAHDNGMPHCDHCVFHTTHRDHLIRIISSGATRAYVHSFMPFVENLLEADPDALVVANECRMMVPLDTANTHPIYQRIQPPPTVLCGTADMMLYTTAQVDGGKFVRGHTPVIYVIDWKTTQKTASVLKSVYRPFNPESEPIPLRYVESSTSFAIMAPCTTNQYYIQVSTYCLMANRLFGMISRVLICVLKYTAEESASLKGYGTFLYEPDSINMTDAWTEILSSMVSLK